MTDKEHIAEEILKSYFDQTAEYISGVFNSGDDYMDYLRNYYVQAWKVPKIYKGNSSGMGFVPEFLIFEVVKKHLENKYKIKFKILERTRISSDFLETAYFIDNDIDPKFLLIQGVKIRENKFGFPLTNYQHDVTYAVKDGTWKIKAVFEVKGYYESSSLKGDIDRLVYAENNYVRVEDCVFAFVGFIRSSEISKPAKERIRDFVNGKNHFFISPGEIILDVGNTSLEKVLDRI